MSSTISGATQHHERRWQILAVIGLAQLMVVLDVTIVNIALPSTQADLGFADASRQWVITAYALAFGSLLLLGGRLGDLIGRKWVFIAGLLGFAGASALGGSAPNFETLVFARALQGACGALLAPAALSIMTTIFTDPVERGKAFGIYGAIAGSGAAVGLLLGGVLTEVLSWRWCMYVNLAFAVPAAFAALRLLVNIRPDDRPHVDVPGVLLASSGLFALVYGFSNAERDSWGAPLTVALLAAGVILLTIFALYQRRVASPLLPLGVVTDRNRGGSLIAIGCAGVAMFGAFLFLTYFMQENLGLSPIQCGLAFLPMVAVIMITATGIAARLLPRVGPRPLIPTGMVLAGAGLAFLTGITPESTYAGNVLPGLLVMGVGFGLIMAPSFETATNGVAPSDAGVASAMVNTSQQIGGSLGTALLSTMFANAAAGFIPAAGTAPASAAAQAAVHGYTVAFWWGAAILAIGGVITALTLRGRSKAPAESPALSGSLSQGVTSSHHFPDG